MKRNTILLIIILFNFSKMFSQTEKVLRINFLNPAVELETPTGKYSSFSIALGVGYGGSYPHTTASSESGTLYSFNPFLDLQQKWFYNFEKRKVKGRNISHNSGNYISSRLLVRGNTISSNFERTGDFDFAVGPTWGIQRKYGKSFHLLFDVGPIYYFDLNGNGYIFPIMLQINLGIDL